MSISRVFEKCSIWWILLWPWWWSKMSSVVEQAKDVNSDLRKQLDKGYLMVYPPNPETKPTVSDEDYYLPRIYFFVPWLTYPEMEPKCKCKRKYSRKAGPAILSLDELWIETAATIS